MPLSTCINQICLYIISVNWQFLHSHIHWEKKKDLMKIILITNKAQIVFALGLMNENNESTEMEIYEWIEKIWPKHFKGLK